MPLIIVFEIFSQANLCEFDDSLVYTVRSRSVWSTQRNPVMKKTKQNKNNQLRNNPTFKNKT